MKNDKILAGYSSLGKSYEVKDYPYGYNLRTSIFYWIETKKGKGDRFCSCTINPKNGRHNKPKYGTYNTFAYMYIDEQCHVTSGAMNPINIEAFEMDFNRTVDMIGIENISEEQQDNIRRKYHESVTYNILYELSVFGVSKQPEEEKKGFINWAKDKLKHITTCPFKDLVTYPPNPLAGPQGKDQ